jgi:hypothetical protein
MTEVEKSYDLNESVDEIFSEYSINQIKLLSDKYKAKADSAKSDLHNLVGLKYRDLIRISESIQDMYDLGNIIDQDLSNLSYKPSKFINFNSNSFSKYDTLIRKNQVIEVQKNSKKPILTNLIINRLISIDSKLSLTIHTHKFLKFAKIYFTIENKFDDILNANSHLKSTYDNLKHSFNQFLITNLSNYNILNTQPNDSKRINQSLTLQDFYKSSHDVDIFDDEEFVIDENGYDQDYSYASSSTTSSSYYSSTYPIINYLLSYMILNKFPSTNMVENFIQMRYDYLELILLQVDFNKTINFLPLWKYLQNTCEYVNFLLNSNSEFYEFLAKIKSWNASDSIGYRHWLHNDLVFFTNESYMVEIPQTLRTIVENKLNQIVSYTYKFIDDNMRSKQGEFSSINYPIALFSNFINSLKELQEYLESNDKQFLIIKYLNDSSLLTEFCRRTFKIVHQNFQSFFNQKFQSGITNLESYSQNQSIQLFSEDIFRLMDTNMDQYISTVTKNTQTSDMSGFIRDWFRYYTQFSKGFSSDNLDTFSDKFTDQIIFGDFTGELINESFANLKQETNSYFWDNIDRFCKLLRDELSNKHEVKTIYNYIDLLITTKSGINNFKPAESLSTMINECIRTCFSIIVENIHIDLESGYFDKLSDTSIEGFPNTPSLMITRALFNISRQFLFIDNETMDFNRGKLFIDLNSAPIFKESKNKMLENFVDKLIDELLVYLSSKTTAILPKEEVEEKTEKYENNKVNQDMDKLDYKTEDKDENLENIVTNVEEKDEVQVEDQVQEKTDAKAEPINKPIHDLKHTTFARSLLVDIVFVLQFTSTKIDSNHTQINKLLDKINYNHLIIDNTATKIIFKIISDYYNASKAIYLPILVN